MIDVILGLQWGDEGKGKIADFLTPEYNLVARFQGGPNAGHSIAFKDKKVVLNTIPSGIFHPRCVNVVGSGVVVDPVRIKDEIKRVEDLGAHTRDNLVFSKKATLIVPTHRVLDAATELYRGKKKIGSTLRGIGPAYRDKIGRSAFRLGDIFLSDFKKQYKERKKIHLKQIDFFGFVDFELLELEEEFFDAIELLKKYTFEDTEYLINDMNNAGKKILAEGAQGAMLDIDFGSYPYVTSSSTISGGVCTGLGVAPSTLGTVAGIFKAYCTRVGSGPFPTELTDQTGELLRLKGNEFGATTGRPRRCGWLDLVALKYAVMISGVSKFYMMKSDVLSGFDKIKVCVAYKVNGNKTDRMPSDICNEKIEPVFKEFPGWAEDITKCKHKHELPDNFLNYVKFIETFTGVEVSLISVGPDREETVRVN